MEKTLYVGIYEGYPLSINLVDGVLTFRYTNLWGKLDEYEYIQDEEETDYDILRKEFKSEKKRLFGRKGRISEDEIIYIIGEILFCWDVGIYSKEGRELEDWYDAWYAIMAESQEARELNEENIENLMGGKIC